MKLNQKVGMMISNFKKYSKLILSSIFFNSLSPGSYNLYKDVHADFLQIRIQQMYSPSFAGRIPVDASDDDRTKMQNEITEEFIKTFRNIYLKENEKRTEKTINEARKFKILEREFQTTANEINKFYQDREEVRLEKEQTVEGEMRKTFSIFVSRMRDSEEYANLESNLTLLFDTHMKSIKEKLAELSLAWYSLENTQHKIANNQLISILYKKILHMISKEEESKHLLDFSFDDTSSVLLKQLNTNYEKVKDSVSEDIPLLDIISKINNPEKELSQESKDYIDEIIDLIAQVQSIHKALTRLKIWHTLEADTIA